MCPYNLVVQSEITLEEKRAAQSSDWQRRSSGGGGGQSAGVGSSISTTHVHGVAALRLLQGLCASQIAVSQHLATALEAAATPHEAGAMAQTFYAMLVGSRIGNAGAGFVAQFGREWRSEAVVIWEGSCEQGRVTAALQGTRVFVCM